MNTLINYPYFATEKGHLSHIKDQTVTMATCTCSLGKRLNFPPTKQPFRSLSDIQLYAKDHMFSFLSQYAYVSRMESAHGCFMPDYPFATLFYINPNIHMPIECLWFFWCIGVLYHFPIEFKISEILHFFSANEKKSLTAWTFLDWFAPVEKWIKLCSSKLIATGGDNIIFVLHRPYAVNPSVGMVPVPSYHVWGVFSEDFTQNGSEKLKLMEFLCARNGIIPPWNRDAELSITSYHGRDGTLKRMCQQTDENDHPAVAKIRKGSRGPIEARDNITPRVKLSPKGIDCSAEACPDTLKNDIDTKIKPTEKQTDSKGKQIMVNPMGKSTCDAYEDYLVDNVDANFKHDAIDWDGFGIAWDEPFSVAYHKYHFED